MAPRDPKADKTKGSGRPSEGAKRADDASPSPKEGRIYPGGGPSGGVLRELQAEQAKEPKTSTPKRLTDAQERLLWELQCAPSFILEEPMGSSIWILQAPETAHRSTLKALAKRGYLMAIPFATASNDRHLGRKGTLWVLTDEGEEAVRELERAAGLLDEDEDDSSQE